MENRITEDHNEIAAKMSPPWIIYVRKLKKFFEDDSSIKISYDANEDPNTVYILVNNVHTYDALRTLLKDEITFGSFTLCVDIQLSLNGSQKLKNAYRDLLKGNPVMKHMDIIQPEGCSNEFVYISFQNEVVKIWTDNLGNPYGNSFMLYEQIAEEIFKPHDGIMFTTAEE